MQALKNKLHRNNASSSTDQKHHRFGKKNAAPLSSGLAVPQTTVSTGPAPTSALRETEAIAQTLPHGSTVERIENKTTTVSSGGLLNQPASSTFTEVKTIKKIPSQERLSSAPLASAPLASASMDRSFSSSSSSSSYSGSSSAYLASGVPSGAAIIQQQLPVEIIEKPIVVHEEIRREQVEEIQPVINIEKLKTEVHQVTQPLFDKETKSVNLQQRTLASETLPEVILPGRGVAREADVSTVHVQDSAAVIVEKPAIYNEVDKIQVIEEIQPVLYKETVVPTVIQETKPVYQKIVEGANYHQETLAARSLQGTQYERGFEHEKVVPLVRAAAPVSSFNSQALPTQIVEKPIVVHEEVRREQVEEIQPIVNIEKLKTEVHQVTQPYFDKETKSVNLQQRTLAAEVLPEVILPGRGVSAAADISSVHYQDRASVIIEKPAVYNEIDRIQVIEEIQPVLYKETVVPTVIQETKNIYQKVVEGAVYTQSVLPPKDLSGSHFSSLHTSTWTETQMSSGMSGMNLNSGMSLNTGRSTGQFNQLPTGSIPIQEGYLMNEKIHARPDKLVETSKTTTTTTTQNSANLPTYAL